MKAYLLVTNRGKIKKGAEIVALYNELGGGHEESTVKYAKHCVIAEVPGIKGGVWMERLGGQINIIYYAAFEEKDQGKGYLNLCIAAIREQYDIDGVQVNPFDNWEVWQHLGFKRQDMLNFVPTLTHHSKKEFAKICLSANR